MNYELRTMKRLFFGLIIFLIMILGVMFVINVIQDGKATEKLALEQAKASYSKDLLYRKWASMHGGVYVPITEKGQPNPYLDVKNRDIVTVNGKKYTLINPAYMTRQVHELGEKSYGIKGHITSLNPINPGNKPDEWEKRALNFFRKGKKEFFSVEEEDNGRFMRYMEPMFVEQSCLKCHAMQGYKLGEIRGGISVKVPMNSYEDVHETVVKSLFFTYLTIFFISFGLLSLVYRFLIMQVKTRIELEEKAELSEKRYAEFMKTSLSVVNFYEFREPMPVNLGLEQALLWIKENLYLAESNDAYADILGYDSVEEIIGKTYFELVNSDHEVHDKVVTLHYERNFYVRNLETEEFSKSGERICFLTNSAPVIKNDLIYSIQATSVDITERKLAAEALIESEQKYKRLTEHSPALIYKYSVQGFGGYRYVNATVKEITGYTEKDFYRNPELGIELTQDNDKELMRRILTGSAGSGKPLHLRWKRKDGGIIWIEHYQIPVLGESGELVAVDCLALDITDKKSAEDALKSSEQQFADFMDNIPVFAYIKDDNLRYIFRNEQAMNFPDFDKVSVSEGRKYLNEKLSEELKRAEKKILNDSEYEEVEYETELNERKVVLRDIKFPITMPDGNRFIGGVTIDLTESRMMEKQVRQAQKMQAIGLLAGGIAHDFNNVLGGMFGFIEMSLDEVDSGSGVAENLRMVLQAGERAKKLVKQILTFSRQESEELEVLEIDDVVNEALELIKVSSPSSVRIVAEIEKDTYKILGNSTQIHELLMNLATNAVYAMNEKGELSIRLYKKTLKNKCEGKIGGVINSGNYTVVEVADTGTGIPVHMKDKIFEPFFTTKEVGRGTGMGLSVVYGVLENCGGNIQVESAIGKGTLFRMFFPESVNRLADLKKKAQKTEDVSGEGRILLVDDENLIIKIGSRILNILGYSVDATTSSTGALDILRDRASEFDLLITDQTMPNMTGIELAKEALAIRPDLPVILSTGFSSQMTVDKANEAGIKGVLNKPFTKYEMGKKIREVLKNEENTDN